MSLVVLVARESYGRLVMSNRDFDSMTSKMYEPRPIVGVSMRVVDQCPGTT